MYTSALFWSQVFSLPSIAPPSIYNQVPIVTPHLPSMPPVENSSIAWICALNYELHKNPTRGLCTAHKKAFLLCLIKPSLRFPFVWFKTNRFISISQKNSPSSRLPHARWTNFMGRTSDPTPIIPPQIETLPTHLWHENSVHFRRLLSIQTCVWCKSTSFNFVYEDYLHIVKVHFW